MKKVEGGTMKSDDAEARNQMSDGRHHPTGDANVRPNTDTKQNL